MSFIDGPKKNSLQTLESYEVLENLENTTKANTFEESQRIEHYLSSN